MSYEINLFCPICSQLFRLVGNKCGDHSHDKEFGWVCSAKCGREAKLKYARMILDKKEDDERDLIAAYTEMFGIDSDGKVSG